MHNRTKLHSSYIQIIILMHVHMYVSTNKKFKIGDDFKNEHTSKHIYYFICTEI